MLEKFLEQFRIVIDLPLKKATAKACTQLLVLEIEIDNNLKRYLLELHFINHCI